GEEVAHACRVELVVELDVLGVEAHVPLADVEREERRSSLLVAPEGLDESVRARTRVPCGRAEIEYLRPRRGRRMEVTAPRLHHPEVVEVVQREEHGAVATGREADQGAALAVGDRP